MPSSGEEAYQSVAVAVSSSTASAEEPIEEDDKYYIDGTFVCFQVGRCLFRVPTYRFANESQFFAGMFSLPQSTGDDAEGCSRMNPIHIPDNVRQTDFRNFLKVLYPLNVSLHISLSKEEWISVLRLSTFWYFLKYREIAVFELRDGGLLTPGEKVLYGREFKVYSLLMEGFTDLVNENDAIYEEEALVIGYKTAFWLSKLRERRWHGEFNKNNKRGFSSGASPSAMANAIEDEFKDELDLILLDEEGYKAEDIEPKATKEADNGEDDILPIP